MGKPGLTFVIVLIVSATTGSSLFAGGDPLTSDSIVFQAFYWDVPGAGTWYNTIKNEAPGLKSAGFTHFWFPPPTKGASGGYSMGYDLYDNYDLGNYNQKGTVETRFGSLSELQAAAAACGNVLLDLVANHMTGATSTCIDPGNGQTYWQRFQYVHHTFEKDCSCFHPGDPADSDGYPYLMFEDVAHMNPYVFNGQRDWAIWMKSTVGNVSGFRLDAVKHYSWDMAKEFGTIGSCIGEYWDSKSNILSWMSYTGNYAWDFPLYYSMQGNAADMDGAGLCSNKGVSFVANHDTDDISQKSRAYGYIMYITPTPCVFWPHWFDSSLYPDIRRALEARKIYNFSGTGTVYKTTNLIIFNNNGLVYGCFNSAGTTGSGTITASPNTTYRAIAWGPGDRPSNVTSNGSGSVTLTVPAKGYCYWYGGSIGTKAAVPDPVNGATNVSPNVDLSWLAGDGAVSHDVYFGTDYNDVNDAADPNVLPGRGNQTATTFDPGVLDNDTTYYWRINEVGTGGTTTGIVWSFTTTRGLLSAYDTVHVPGDKTAVFGSSWNPAGAENEMTLIADYTWRWESDISTATSVEYKFAMNGSWGINRGLGSTSGTNLPQENWSLAQDGGNIHANLPAATCVWEYYENTETSKLYVNVDFDIDGDVDFDDYAIFTSHWMDENCTEPDFCDGTDLNKSGSVD
ncbi:MAG: alpha-amylase family glycosyl hydrolase, partial [Planctomycetota bacterium]